MEPNAVRCIVSSSSHGKINKTCRLNVRRLIRIIGPTSALNGYHPVMRAICVNLLQCNLSGMEVNVVSVKHYSQDTALIIDRLPGN